MKLFVLLLAASSFAAVPAGPAQLARQCDAGIDRACAQLNRLATLGAPATRAAAIRRLQDVSLLRTLAADDRITTIRKAAAARLAEVMKGVPDAAAAVQRIRTILELPAVRGRVPSIEVISTIEATAKAYPARWMAGEKVTIALRADGRTLGEGTWGTVFPAEPTAKLWYLPPVIDAGALVTQLLDKVEFSPDELAALATAENAGVRAAAVAKVTDQAALGRAAMDPDAGVRRLAIGRLKDQEVLERVALVDREADIRIAALAQVTNEAILAKVAMADPEEAIRVLAASRVTSEPLLAPLTETTQPAGVRRTAIGRIFEDQVTITRVALNDTESDIRDVAISRVKSQATLETIVRNSTDQKNRAKAAGLIHDQTVLTWLVRSGEFAGIRRVAVEKLTSVEILVGIAANDADAEMKKLALARLTVMEPNEVRREIALIKASGRYGALPTPQAIRTGSSYGPVSYNIKNDTQYTLTVMFSGGETRKVVLSPGGSDTVSVSPGMYHVAARVSAEHVIPFYADQTYEAGVRYQSSFYIRSSFR